jgi:hypothetical protein
MNHEIEASVNVTIIARVPRRMLETRRQEPRARTFRIADTDGPPMINFEFCNLHGRMRIEHDRVAVLKVYDDCEVTIPR